MERTQNNLIYLIDTHALYWYYFDPKILPERIKKIINRSGFSVSTIILAELEALLLKKNITAQNQNNIWKFLEKSKIIAFDQSIFTIFRETDKKIDIHDRIIVATAVSINATIISKDRIIAKFYPKVLWD